MPVSRTTSEAALRRPVTPVAPPAGLRARGALGRPLAIALLVIAQQGALVFGVARVRTVLLLAAAALALGVWRRRRELLRGEHRAAAAALFAASLVIALLPLVMRPSALDAFAAA
ncbi:MAG TPA: hypothetical protein VFS05_05930, partial [Gemmatimonadaceae bacterium]|nr:hypothetical protein [Gemmatimonadaceae bacterium]